MPGSKIRFIAVFSLILYLATGPLLANQAVVKPVWESGFSVREEHPHCRYCELLRDELPYQDAKIDDFFAQIKTLKRESAALLEQAPVEHPKTGYWWYWGDKQNIQAVAFTQFKDEGSASRKHGWVLCVARKDLPTAILGARTLRLRHSHGRVGLYW